MSDRKTVTLNDFDRPERPPVEDLRTLTEDQVVRHLMFHKAILTDDPDEAGRINGYIELVKTSGEGEHVGIEDPFERSIALAFELVLENHLDPWRMDLLQFVNLYLERVHKHSDDMDLITAGRLVLMAWRILRMQSEDLRQRADPPPPPEPEEMDPWDLADGADWMVDDADYQYTTEVIRGEEAPIDEKVRHRGDRKVTFMELLEALEEARKDAELRKEVNEKRIEARAKYALARKGRAEGAAHKEDQEADIAETWERISRLNGHPIPLTDLHGRDRLDLMKAFVSILFLARQQRVKIWQEDFPYGMIYIQNVTLDKVKPVDAPELQEGLSPN